MEVYLIRHTVPSIEKGIVYGQLDIDVANSFMDEAALIQQKLPSDFDFVFSSPSLRCVKLANLLFSDFQMDTRLQEINFGQWEGRKWDDIPLEELNPWMADYENVAPPGGENAIQLRARIQEFKSFLEEQSLQKVALVSHAGVIRVFKSIIEGKNIKETFNEKIEYGSISVLKW
ncbi:MAG: alpha-ribazole phosphatase family protein [Cytophagales bacterium]|nr:alpha-ribazole phosphatase family protein [Cytophagales bacterium]